MRLRSKHAFSIVLGFVCVPLLACYVEEAHRPHPPQGQQQAYVENPPPPPPPQQDPPPPPPPAPDYEWIAGYQRWNGNGYSWEGGHYEHRPHEGAHYERGHWQPQGSGQVWVDGRWN